MKKNYRLIKMFLFYVCIAANMSAMEITAPATESKLLAQLKLANFFSLPFNKNTASKLSSVANDPKLGSKLLRALKEVKERSAIHVPEGECPFETTRQLLPYKDNQEIVHKNNLQSKNQSELAKSELAQFTLLSLQKNSAQELSAVAHDQGNLDCASRILWALMEADTLEDCIKIKDAITPEFTKAIKSLAHRGNIRALCLSPAIIKNEKKWTDMLLRELVNLLKGWESLDKKKSKNLIKFDQLVERIQTRKSLDEVREKDASHFILSGFLSLLKGSAKKQDNISFTQDVLVAIELLNKAINSQAVVTNKESIPAIIQSMYRILLHSEQNDSKKKFYLQQMLKWPCNNREALEENLSSLVLTTCYSQSSSQERAQAHDFYEKKSTDPNFVKEKIENYHVLGNLFAKGANGLRIEKDLDKAEIYLRAVASLPISSLNRESYTDTLYSLGRLLIDKQLALGQKIVSKEAGQEISSIFLKALAFGDWRGKFGLGFLAYWQNKSDEAKLLLAEYWDKLVYTIPSEESILCAWYLGTLLLLEDTPLSIHEAVGFFHYARPFGDPKGINEYSLSLYKATPEVILERIVRWAQYAHGKLMVEASLNDTDRQNIITCLLEVGLLELSNAKTFKSGLRNVCYAAEKENSLANLYMGSIPQIAHYLPLNARVKYLNKINQETPKDLVWLEAQRQIIYLAQIGCIDAQVSTLLNLSEHAHVIKWLNALMENPQPLALIESVQEQSSAFMMLAESPAWNILKDLCDKDETGAQFLMASVFISCGNYQAGIPLLQKVYSKVSQSKNSCAQAITQFLVFVESRYAVALLESLKQVNKEERFKYIQQACFNLQSSISAGSQFAKLAQRLMLASGLPELAQLKNIFKDTMHLKDKKDWRSFEDAYKSLIAYEKELLKSLFASIKDTFNDVSIKDKLSKLLQAAKESDDLDQKPQKDLMLENIVVNHNNILAYANKLIDDGKAREGFACLEKLAEEHNLDACMMLVVYYLDGKYDNEKGAIGYYIFANTYFWFAVVHASGENAEFLRLNAFVKECREGKHGDEHKKRADKINQEAEKVIVPVGKNNVT